MTRFYDTFLPMFIYILGLVLSACTVKLSRLRQVTISSQAAPYTIVTDIVFASSKELADQIKKMDASAYFAQITNLQRLYGQLLHIYRIEQLPSSVNALQLLDAPTTAYLTMFFADYRTADKSCLIIDKQTKSIKINLGPDKIQQVQQFKRLDNASFQTLPQTEQVYQMR